MDPIETQAPLSETQTAVAPSPVWLEEPFRIFFPLGVAASLFGVLIWPLFYAGLWPYPPHLQHPRLMIFGFGFAFVIGFLGTAWPRFLEAAVIRKSELAILLGLWFSAQFSYAIYELRTGDGFVFLLALALLVILSSRLSGRLGLLPPGFQLAFLSVFSGGLVTFWWAVHPPGDSPRFDLMARLLVWQGLLLFPLLGVGSYLFARFFPVADDDLSLTKPRNRAAGVWAAAVIVLVSFAMEAMGWVRSGNLLRFGAVAVWIFFAVPALWRHRAVTTRAMGLKIAIGCIASSFLVRGIHPGPGYAIEHLLFLGGFGLAILITADRVTHGHCGDLAALPAKSALWRWVIALLLIAALTRASADYKASILISHHVYAALLWSVAVGILSIHLSRLWFRKPGRFQESSG